MHIPLNKSTFGEEEISSAVEVLRSGYVTMGAVCSRFEERFAEKLKSKNAIFVNSGSSANLLAFFALANAQFEPPSGTARLMPGDEVIVPAVTWSTTVWPIVQAGGVPVLVDSDPSTLQMNVDGVLAAIGPRTRGICPVHVLGNSVNMEPLMAIAKQHGLWIVEDTCEALGTMYGNKAVGTLGLVGTYSFFFSHHITTIEGGMVVTDDDNLAELMRCMRAHGWTRHLKNRKRAEAQYSELDPRFLFVNTGFNLRPTEINAAFGLHQIEKLDAFNRRRVEIAGQWQAELSSLVSAEHFMIMQPTPNAKSTWFGFPIVCRDEGVRRGLQVYLESKGIETRPIIAGNLARQPAFKHIKHRVAGDLTGADRIMDCGLFWGSHPTMVNDEIQYVAETVKGYFKS